MAERTPAPLQAPHDEPRRDLGGTLLLGDQPAEDPRRASSAHRGRPAGKERGQPPGAAAPGTLQSLEGEKSERRELRVSLPRRHEPEGQDPGSGQEAPGAGRLGRAPGRAEGDPGDGTPDPRTGGQLEGGPREPGAPGAPPAL